MSAPIIVPHIPSPLEAYLAVPYRMPLIESYPVIRVPVAGPAPFTTLVIARGKGAVSTYRQADGKLTQWRSTAVSPFKLRGFDPAGPNPAFQHSTTAALQVVQTTGDSWFCAAIISLEGRFDTTGQWVLDYSLAEAWDQVYAGAFVYFSSWILCVEPPAAVDGPLDPAPEPSFAEQVVSAPTPVFSPPTPQSRLERATRMTQLMYRAVSAGDATVTRVYANGASDIFQTLMADPGPLDREAIAQLLAQVFGYQAGADQPAAAAVVVQYRRQLLVPDPSDHASRNGLATALYGLAVAHYRAGNVPATQAAATESSELFQGLMADPGPLDPEAIAQLLAQVSGYR